MNREIIRLMRYRLFWMIWITCLIIFCSFELFLASTDPQSEQKTVEEITEYLHNRQVDADRKLSIPLFMDVYSQKRLSKEIHIYSTLTKQLSLHDSLKPTKLFTTWGIDLSIGLMGIFLAWFFMHMDDELGISPLLDSTATGEYKKHIQRLFTMFMLLLSSTVILYMLHFLLVGPIEGYLIGRSGFTETIYPWSLIKAFFITTAIHFLALIVMIMCFSILLLVSKRVSMSLFLLVIICALSYFIYHAIPENSLFRFIKYTNIYAMMNTSEILNQAVWLNVFQHAVRPLVWIMICVSVMAGVSILILLQIPAVKATLPLIKGRNNMTYHTTFHRLNGNGFLFVLLLGLLLWCLWSVYSYEVNREPGAQYFDQYLRQWGGEMSQEKVKEIEAIHTLLVDLQYALQNVNEQLTDSTTHDELLQRKQQLIHELDKWPAFQLFYDFFIEKQQASEDLIDRRPFDRLFSIESPYNLIYGLFISMLVTMLLTLNGLEKHLNRHRLSLAKTTKQGISRIYCRLQSSLLLYSLSVLLIVAFTFYMRIKRHFIFIWDGSVRLFSIPIDISLSHFAIIYLMYCFLFIFMLIEIGLFIRVLTNRPIALFAVFSFFVVSLSLSVKPICDMAFVQIVQLKALTSRSELMTPISIMLIIILLVIRQTYKKMSA